MCIPPPPPAPGDPKAPRVTIRAVDFPYGEEREREKKRVTGAKSDY